MRNSYSISQKITLAVSLVRSKLICRSVRLFRFPIDLRGRKMIDFGKNLTTGRFCRIEAIRINNEKEKKIIFGTNVQINDSVHICALKKVEIGNDVLIAGHVYISDNSHGMYKGDENDSSPFISPMKRNYFISPVCIGDNTWIGEGVIIMPGVKVGRGCIVGAHSIVNHDIPDNCMVVGSPARIIKRYSIEKKRWEKTSDE